MKAVLMSINPKYCELIAQGKKTIEVRKTMPKIDVPFKVYIYETKGYDTLFGKGKPKKLCVSGGRVIGEFVCENIECLNERDLFEGMDEISNSRIEEYSCLCIDELLQYKGNKEEIYGWHISDLVIYDKPRELSEFYKPLKYDGDGVICGTEKEINDIYEWDCETVFGEKYPDFDFANCECENCPKARDFYRLTRPPQSWCYVEELVV